MSNAPQPAAQTAGKSPDLVRHMIGCEPCDGHLGELKSTPDVLDHLVNAGRAENTSSRVEGVLSVAGRQGDFELQRLLYELGRSSLALIPEYHEGRQLIDVKPIEVVSHQLEAMIPRSEPICASEATEAARAFAREQTQRPERPAELALSLGEVLSRLQDKPSFGMFLVGDAAHHLRNFDRSLNAFEEVHRHSALPQLRSAAAQGVMYSLFATKRFAEALSFSDNCDEAVRQSPAFWLNRATACAWVESPAEAWSSLKQFAAVRAPQDDLAQGTEWWDEQARFFSERTNRSINEVRSALNG